MHFKHAEGMIACWLEELSQYDMTIQHRPGKAHGNADGLSCIPDHLDFCDCYEAGTDLSTLPCGGCPYCTRIHHQWSRFEETVDDVVPLSVRAVSEDAQIPFPTLEEMLSADFHSDSDLTAWLPQYSATELWKAQEAESNISKLLHWIEADLTPTTAELYLCSPEVKQFWLAWKHLVVRNGVLYYKWEDVAPRFLLMVPYSLCEEVLEGCHDCPTSDHLGQNKTLAQVKHSFMWHDMSADVQVMCCLAICAARTRR